MDGKISRQTPFLTDNIHNRDMYVSVEIILSGLPFQSTENISYGYDDSELNGLHTGCPKKNARLGLEANNSSLEAAIGTCRPIFEFLRFSAFI